MKRPNQLIAAAVAAGALSLAHPVPAQAPTQPRLHTAVIDVQRILAESEEGKKEIARIKKVQDERLQKLNLLEAEVQKLKDKLTDLGFSISEEERTKLQRQIEDKMIDGERYRKDADREIKSQFEDVFASFEKRIFPIIEAMGIEKGIQLILNKDMPGLVWADKSMDITSDVIERFNKMAASGSLPAPAKAPSRK
jgi:Skp family chaperone for outer membrane proteins